MKEYVHGSAWCIRCFVVLLILMVMVEVRRHWMLSFPQAKWKG
jgi:hypothetical protein